MQLRNYKRLLLFVLKVFLSSFKSYFRQVKAYVRFSCRKTYIFDDEFFLMHLKRIISKIWISDVFLLSNLLKLRDAEAKRQYQLNTGKRCVPKGFYCTKRRDCCRDPKTKYNYRCSFWEVKYVGMLIIRLYGGLRLRSGHKPWLALH